MRTDIAVFFFLSQNTMCFTAHASCHARCHLLTQKGQAHTPRRAEPTGASFFPGDSGSYQRIYSSHNRQPPASQARPQYMIFFFFRLHAAFLEANEERYTTALASALVLSKLWCRSRCWFKRRISHSDWFPAGRYSRRTTKEEKGQTCLVMWTWSLNCIFVSWQSGQIQGEEFVSMFGNLMRNLFNAKLTFPISKYVEDSTTHHPL